jgi:hypothetical protein
MSVGMCISEGSGARSELVLKGLHESFIIGIIGVVKKGLRN